MVEDYSKSNFNDCKFGGGTKKEVKVGNSIPGLTVEVTIVFYTHKEWPIFIWCPFSLIVIYETTYY